MKNKYLNSFLKTVIFFGVLHLVTLTVLAITTSNFEYLNVFRILELNEIFPGIENGTTSLVVSFLFILGIFLFNLKRNKG